MAEESQLNGKHQRLHQLALSLHRDGDNNSALRCWKRIRDENPQFPGIDKWIAVSAAAVFEASSPKARKIEPSVYKTQKQIVDRYSRRKSTSFRFQPKPSPIESRKLLRHRHIAYLMMIGILLFFIASLRNMRSYQFVLEPESGILNCYQGMFFPVGWEKTKEMSIGLEPGWEANLEDEILSLSLLSGLKVHSLEDFDRVIISLYQKLGQNALKHPTIEKQREAIYYFKKIETANFRKLIAWDISTAYFNLAKLNFETKQDWKTALNLLETIKQYIPSYPGAKELGRRIDSYSR